MTDSRVPLFGSLAPPQQSAIDEVVDKALREDLGSSRPILEDDITTAWTVGAAARIRASIIAKQPGIISGTGVACAVFQRLDHDTHCSVLVPDGGSVDVDTTQALNLTPPIVAIGDSVTSHDHARHRPCFIVNRGIVHLPVGDQLDGIECQHVR